MLKVSFHRSLAFKLFVFISAMLLITIGANAWQNGRLFHTQLLLRIQEKTMQNARQTANSADAIIEAWVSQMIVITNSINDVPRSKYNGMIQTLTAANPDFLMFELVAGDSPKTIEAVASTTTKYPNDERFGGAKHDDVLKKIKWRNRAWVKELVARKDKPGFVIKNLMPEIGLPVVSLAIQFTINNGDGGGLWAVLSVWQTKLYGAIASPTGEAVVIIDEKGRIVSSSDVKILRKAKVDTQNPIVVEALRQKAPDGFRDWTDDGGDRVLGAFAKIKKFRLIALTESDGASAYQAVQLIVGRTMLWAGLLILVAMFLSFVASSGITKNLRTLMGTTVRIADGDFKARVEAGSTDEVGLLGHAVNHMAGQLGVLVNDRVEKARLESELQTAKLVQEKFFPKEGLDDDAFKLVSFFEPASECGGDWWGHNKIGDKLHLVCIADATGHGVPAALVTAMVFAAASMVARQLRNLTNKKGAAAWMLEEFNKTLWESGRGTHTMTFFAAILDLEKGTLTYANAGHNFPFLVRGKKGLEKGIGKGGKPPKVREPLSMVATPLGIEPESVYKEKTLPLHPGDKVFFYTDGLFECTNSAKDMWGKRRFLKQIEDASELGIEAFRDNVVNAAYQHFAGYPADDDITVVVIEYADAAAKAATAPTEREAS